MTTLKYKSVKTRKINRCFSCLRDFPIGTIMFRWSVVDYGDFNNGHTCETCDKIHDINRGDLDDGIPEGYVHECLSIGETPEMYLNNLKPKQP